MAAVAAVVWGVAYQLNGRWWDWLVFDLAGLDRSTRVGESVHFFFFDVTKIALLLSGVIFAVTILRSFMSVERTRALSWKDPFRVRRVAPETEVATTPRLRSSWRYSSTTFPSRWARGSL